MYIEALTFLEIVAYFFFLSPILSTLSFLVQTIEAVFYIWLFILKAVEKISGTPKQSLGSYECILATGYEMTMW